MPTIPLLRACPKLSAALREALLRSDHAALSDQLDRALLPAQALGADDHSFRFMVRFDSPPGPFRNEPEEPLELDAQPGAASVWLDEFGRLSEIGFQHRPDLYREMKALHGHIGPR